MFIVKSKSPSLIRLRVSQNGAEVVKALHPGKSLPTEKITDQIQNLKAKKLVEVTGS